MALFNELFSKNTKRPNLLVTAKGIIYNKFVLYAVFLGALFDLLYSAVKEDYLYCVIFILVGFLSAFFSKNMTVILTITMALSTIIRNIIRGTELKVEGMKEGKNSFAGSGSGAGADDVESDEDYEYAGKSKKSASAPDKGKLMDSLKENALDLQEAQQNIINGFEKIEPYMNQAEDLIGEIEKTAKQIQGMRDMQTV